MLDPVTIYRDTDAVSQSFLKTLTRNSVYRIDDEDEESDSLSIGTITDMLITENTENVSKKYYISDISAPSDTHAKILRYAYRKCFIECTMEEASDLLIEGCIVEKYLPSFTREKKLGRLITAENKLYWDLLFKSNDKKIITKNVAEKAYSTAASLLTNDLTRHKIMNFHYQVPLYFNYRDIPCKALLDILELKDYVCIRDLKTMSYSTDRFTESAKRFRYDIQAAFYTEAVKNFTDKPILPFEFIVENYNNPGNPKVYICTEDDLYTGKYGKTKLNVGAVTIDNIDLPVYKTLKNPILGFDQLITIYKELQEQKVKDPEKFKFLNIWEF